MHLGRLRGLGAVAVVSGSLTAVLTVAGGASAMAPPWMAGLYLAALAVAMGALPLLMWLLFRAGQPRYALDTSAAFSLLMVLRAVCQPYHAFSRLLVLVGAVGCVSGAVLGHLRRQ